MPIVQYSKKDLLRGIVVDPGWYRVVIDTVGEWTPSKDGNSNNMIIEGTIQFNADNGDKKFAETPIGGIGSWSFNTKAMGFSLGLVKALAKQVGLDPADIKADTRLEFSEFEGKSLDVFVENDTYEGTIKNKVTHKYREVKS